MRVPLYADDGGAATESWYGKAVMEMEGVTVRRCRRCHCMHGELPTIVVTTVQRGGVGSAGAGGHYGSRARAMSAQRPLENGALKEGTETE